jgi:hypothetical protein
MSTPLSDAVYLDEPWLSIIWDRDLTCVYARFKAFANSAEFRAGVMRILDAINDKHAPFLISDNRKLEGVAVEDQLWLRDTWMPLAVKAGIKRIAVVLPRQGLGKIASEEVISQFGNTPFVTRTFGSLDEAMKWVVGNEHPRN